MEAKANLLEAVLTYLEQRNYMETVKSVCERYSRQPQQTFYQFEVVVNTLDILDQNARLCHLLLKDALKCQHLFKEAIYRTIKERNWLRMENIGQVTVTLTVTRLPPIPQFEMNSVGEVLRNCRRDEGNPRFCRFDGTIISLSTPSKYTLGASYSCSNVGCQSNSVTGSRRFTRVHIPGAREKQTVSDHFKCSSCGTKLKENVRDRVLADKVVGEMVPLEEMSDLSKESSFRVQSIPVYFRGELMVKRVEIGHSYSIVTLPVCKLPTGIDRCPGVALEANYFEDITAGNQNDNSEQENEAVRRAFCAEMNRLFAELNIKDLAASPFTGPLLMAYCFAGDIAPRGLFLKAKLGILLCLVNDCSKGKRRASLLVVGGETSVIDRLLRYGASLAPRNVPLTTHAQLMSTVRRDTPGTEDDHLFVEANPILMASSGVCYLGDLAKFANSSKRTITNILDTGNVPVDWSSKSKVYSGAPPPTSLPVECQLWAYERGGGIREHFFASSKNSIPHDIGSIPKCLLDAFGLVYFVDFSNTAGGRQKDEELGNHCMAVAMSQCYASDSAFQCHMEKFLVMMKDRDLRFEPDAELLIQGYFVASRRVRGVDGWSSPLPLSALLSITCAAEGHAKLCLRQTVSEDDAIAAIYLYEEFISSIRGISLLGVQPSPHFFSSDSHTLFKKLVSDVEQFGRSLRRYVKDYSLEKLSQRSEE